jgi:hypothetical protein
MFNHIQSCLLSGFAWSAALASTILCGQVGALDEPRKDKEEEARRDQQLKNMKRSAAQYAISPAEDRQRLLKFHENAVMRFSNPVLGTKDCAVYLWSDRGRPQAIVKLYTFDNEHFAHEWQSLSERPIIAECNGKVVWHATEPGITVRELPEAPKPAESAADRLWQMKSLATKFSLTYTHFPPNSKPDDLRLLIQPLFRFEAGDDRKCLDGAIFGFSQGTAPMGLLLFEARQKGESYQWHYALARMAGGEVTAKYDMKEVFSVQKSDGQDPKKTFFILRGQLVPKE